MLLRFTNNHRSLWVIFLFSFLTACSSAEGKAERLIHEENSLYQYIAVIENPERGERYLAHRQKGFIQGGIDLAAPNSLLYEYTRMAFIALPFLNRPPENTLFVGLGAGSMPRYLHDYYPETTIDVIEIDPAVLKTAKKYFYFQEDNRMRVRIADGRMYLKRSAEKYDLIFLDAYHGDTIPFHLTTREFLQETRRKLRKGGVVAANILAPYRNKFFEAMLATYQAEFPQVYVFRGEQSANFIFIATPAERRLDQDLLLSRLEEIDNRRGFDFNLARTLLKYEPPRHAPDSARILTDDFSPVNLYRHMEAN